jgi:type IV secretion system protein VirD4
MIVPPVTLGATDASWAISLGRYLHGPEQFGDRQAYSGERNLLLFGPNGSGKGTRFLMPNLLQMKDCSVVVIDPKGELAAVTAPYRRTVGEVVIINPFGVLAGRPGYDDLKSDGYNPLCALDPASPSFNADASWLAEALVTIEGSDPHWSRSARKLVAALIMHACLKDRGSPSLSEMRRLLTDPVIEPKDGRPGHGIPHTALDMRSWNLPALTMKAGQFTRWNREVESVVSTADTQTEALDDAEIAADLAKPGIDFRELKKRPITVYIILPPDMMERHGRWLRMLISSALRGVMRLREPNEMRVFFFMDEFAALGHLSIIETTWALVRGYGIQLVPVLQDLNQLKELYKERWETFIGMAGVVEAFGPNDLTTADWLSRRSGDTTEVVMGYNIAQQPGGAGVSEGVNYHQVKIPRLTPHELFDTPEGHAHVFLANMANRVPMYVPAYYEIATARERARNNPYFQGA